MIRVLVVEDSKVSRDLLVHILESDPEIEVAGTLPDGQRALRVVQELSPDLVVMDVNMPGRDGFAVTREIMQSRPVPIVMISSTLRDEIAATFEAQNAGAMAFVLQPPGLGAPAHDIAANKLLQAVKLMSEVRPVRRWPDKRRPPVSSRPVREGSEKPGHEARLIAIGASTGGPLVLQGILSAIAKDLNAPVLIVQHIAAGFSAGLADWLGVASGLPVKVAADGESIEPGHVYIAPDDRHMGVCRNGSITLSDDPPEHGLRPAVSYFFRSVAESTGPGAVGVLLTGMGRDGATELKLLRDNGAVTIAQDEASSMVFGMPGEAVRLKGAQHVLPPERIAALLSRIMREEGQRDATGQ